MNKDNGQSDERDVRNDASLNKERCRQLVEEIDAAVHPIAQEFGLHVAGTTCKYNTDRASITLEWCTITEDGVPNSKEAEEFRRYAASKCDLDPSILGQSIRLPGKDGTFRVIGLRRRARKCPVLVRSETTRDIYAVNQALIKLAVQGSDPSSQNGQA